MSIEIDILVLWLRFENFVLVYIIVSVKPFILCNSAKKAPNFWVCHDDDRITFDSQHKKDDGHLESL